MPVSALRDSLLCNLAISFRSRSLFACPRFLVRSLSQTSFLLLLSLQVIEFPSPGFSIWVLLWLRVSVFPLLDLVLPFLFCSSMFSVVFLLELG